VVLGFVLLALCVADQREEDWPSDDIGDTVGKSAKANSKVLKRALDTGVGGYQKIPNFVVGHRSHKVDVKSRVGCQNVCDQHKNCRSFSYRAGDRRCMWSEEALHYDSRFSFFMKVSKMDDMGRMKPTGEYKQFDNFRYKVKGWREIVSGKNGCQDLCNKMNRCGSFSWREHDNLCLLADDSVKYDTDFDYYERNFPKPKKTKMKVLPDLKKAVSEKASKQLEKAIKASHERTKKLRKKVHFAKQAAKKGVEAVEDTPGSEGDDDTKAARKIKEKTKKASYRDEADAFHMQANQIQKTGRIYARESASKATKHIKSAFQEGYMKAQKKNGAVYERDVKEVHAKSREAIEKNAEKITKKTKREERRAKEQDKKEARKKAIKERRNKKEVKTKAEHEQILHSLKGFTDAKSEKELETKKNELKLKKVVQIAESRRKREQAHKKAQLRKAEQEIKHKKKKALEDAKERKEKIHHEADVKDRHELNLKYARKKKEQTLKEIDKKEIIFKREKKEKELQKKIDQAKKDAAEIQEKHKERQAKIGQCEERRAKGQFVTYAYAREATFVSGITADVKFGSEAKYNGMLRVQSGVGNQQQNSYLKFSATGNKIIDEELGDSVHYSVHSDTGSGMSQELGDSMHSDTRRSGMSQAIAAAKTAALVAKSKLRYVLRRRYVDRRRRWSAKPAIPAKNSVLSSRRRALQARRRRSANLEHAVTKAVLKVFKFGGPAAKLVVKAVKCQWSRPTLDFPTANKLAIPVSLSLLSATTFIEANEGQSAELGSYDQVQTGYWGNQRASLGDTSSEPAQQHAPLPTAPFVPARRRYVDRRRRFSPPKTAMPTGTPSDAPPASNRRRRFVGKTAGTAFAPVTNNVWVNIPLSAPIVGVMRSVDKMCFEISGGGAAQPTILGSEKSTNKPHLILNVKSEAGARRRRCSSVVALEALKNPPKQNLKL